MLVRNFERGETPIRTATAWSARAPLGSVRAIPGTGGVPDGIVVAMDACFWGGQGGKLASFGFFSVGEIGSGEE